MLQHLDGSEIDNKDFSCTITTDDANLAWNNALLPSPVVTYSPWNIRYGQTAAPGVRTMTTVSSLLFDMSTSRLSTERDATLTIHRNWDDRDIIRINLIDYLLLVKGQLKSLLSISLPSRCWSITRISLVSFISGIVTVLKEGAKGSTLYSTLLTYP